MLPDASFATSFFSHIKYLRFFGLFVAMYGANNIAVHAAHMELMAQVVDPGIVDGSQILALSPGGEHLYSGNTQGDSVSLFHIDATTGEALYQASYKRGINGVEYLAGVTGLAVSPDGKHVYAAAFDDNALIVFSRDLFNGNLTLVTTYLAGINSSHLEGPTSITISDDALFVYVTSAYTSGITVYARDPSTGLLSIVEQHLTTDYDPLFGVLTNASNSRISPDGNYLYVTAFNPGALTVYARDQIAGTLTFIETHLEDLFEPDDPYELGGARDLTLSADGEFVYVISFYNGGISAFDRDPATGTLTLLAYYTGVTPGQARGNDGASISISPDDTYLYATGKQDEFRVFKRDTETGLLTELARYIDGVDGIEGLGDPYHHIISADGSRLYLTAEEDDRLSVFSRDASTGLLSQDYIVARVDNSPGMLKGAVDVVLSPDNNYVYSSSLLDGAINIYFRNTITGELTHLDTYVNGENGITGISSPGNMLISGDGKYLYVVSYLDNSVMVFARDESTGLLILTGGLAGIYGVHGIEESPDGRHLYLLAFYDEYPNRTHAIFTLSRDEVSGALSVVDSIESTDPGGLENPYDVILSDDGRDVYIVGQSYWHLNHYRRNPATGLLQFIATYDEEIHSPRSLVMSPDNEFIYVANSTGSYEYNTGIRDSVAAYRRDAVTGELAFIASYKDSDYNLSMDALIDMVVSNDGRYIYVAAWLNHTVVAFERSANGELRPIEVKQYTDSMSDPIEGAYGLALNDDGANLYVASFYSHSLVSYTVNSGDMSILQLAPAAPIYSEQVNSFVIEVSNQGVSNTSGVHVSYTAPAGSSVVDASTVDGSCNYTDSEVTCDITQMGPAAMARIFVDVVYESGGQYSHVTKVSASERDENELDNVSKALVKVISIAATPVASVLPGSRSVQVGNVATVFATIINPGSTIATECGIAPLTNIQAEFSYQTTDSANWPIGAPNTPANIIPGGSQSYMIALTPTAAFGPIDVQFTFECANTHPAPVTVGLNTLLLNADSNPVPDIVALAATPTGEGIVNLSGTGVFAVATVNIGSSDTITVSADTGGASLPVSIALCETNPATGVCINPTVPIQGDVAINIPANATPTFAFFVTGTDTVPFDPANNRIFVRFQDTGGVTRGSTSVAVRTL